MSLSQDEVAYQQDCRARCGCYESESENCDTDKCPKPKPAPKPSPPMNPVCQLKCNGETKTICGTPECHLAKPTRNWKMFGGILLGGSLLDWAVCAQATASSLSETKFYGVLVIFMVVLLMTIVAAFAVTDPKEAVAETTFPPLAIQHRGCATHPEGSNGSPDCNDCQTDCPPAA